MTEKTHYQSDILERFIPIALEDLVHDLLNSQRLPVELKAEFKVFCSTYIALFHAQTHRSFREIKEGYQPYNPDRDTVINTSGKTTRSLIELRGMLYSILDNANYERISQKDLDEALNKTSPHGVKVSVDFADFSEVSLFYRGSAVTTKLYRNWKKLSFKKKPIDIFIYRRLFVLLQPKSKQQWLEYFMDSKKMSFKKAEEQAELAFKNSVLSHEDHVIYLKLFKDIPRADLEMLFPNTRIQMRLFDKIKLGVMGSGGTAGGVMATLSKFSAAIDPISALISIGGLLGVIWRQIAKVFSQRAKYSAALTKNLYFYSLANNMSALSYLANSAEEEECKEAILAYFFLLIGGTSRRLEVDEGIEAYIQEHYHLSMDFEIDDGLNKLKKSNLLTRYEDEVIVAVSLEGANKELKRQWLKLIDDDTTAV